MPLHRERTPKRVEQYASVYVGWTAVAMALLLVCTACSDFFVAETLTSIQVSPQNATVAVGGTTQLTATGVNSDGTPANLTNVAWSSSSPQVATVSSTGLVTGVSAGTTTITATAQNISGSATVTAGSSNTGALSITPANQTVSSTLGALQFNATFNGQDVTASSTWSSSNPAVAQFSVGTATGLATFTGQGTTTITASFTSGGSTFTGSTNLTVGP